MFDSVDGPTLSSIFTAVAVYGVAGAAAVSAIATSIFTNQQQQESLITRFGKHIRTVKEPGLNFKAPFIDKVAMRVGMDVIQAKETLSTKTKAGDDIFVKLPITVQYEVSDSALFVFKNRDAAANMMKSVSNAVRAVTSNKSFQELYTVRDEISQEVITHVAAEVAESGINLRRIIIDEPQAPPELEEAYNNVRASERLKEAAKNNAEAEKITVIAASEAAAEAQANAGKGAADFRKAIFEGYKAQIEELTAGDKMSREEALGVVMQAMSLDAMRDVAKHGNVVIIPQNFTGADLAQTKAVQALGGKASPVEAAPPSPAPMVA